MATKEEQAKAFSLLMKEKGIIQAGFTRVCYAFENVLESKKTLPASSCSHYLKDIEERFSKLENKCDELFMLVEENDERHEALSDVLERLNDRLIDLRLRADSIVESAQSHEVTNDHTEALIKSFKASITLPKPQCKKFDGRASDYASFISYIESYMEESVEDSKQRLMFIIDSCTGDAYDSICYLSQCANAMDGYERAKVTLKEFFGGRHKVNRAVMEECVNGPCIKAEDLRSLQRLVISMKKAIVTLTENKCEDDLSSTDKLVKLYQRIPKHLQDKWNDKVMEIRMKDKSPSFLDMCALIERYVKSRDNEYCQSELRYTSHPVIEKRNPVLAVSNDSDNAKLKCDMCSNSHYLNQCPEFVLLPVKERYNFVCKSRRCRNCLHTGHVARNCERNSLCKRCKYKHNDLLHDNNFWRKDESVSPGPVNLNDNQNADTGKTLLNVNVAECVVGLSCVDVLVEGKDSFFKCKAVVDSKSSVNLCTNRLLKKLNLPCVRYDTSLSVATGTYKVSGQKISQAKVFAKGMNDYVVANNVMGIDTIPLAMDSIFTEKDLAGIDHLQWIEIPSISNSDEIDLLIGSGVPKAFHKYEERKGADHEIYAVRQTLGWDLVGMKALTAVVPDAPVLFTSQTQCGLKPQHDDCSQVSQILQMDLSADDKVSSIQSEDLAVESVVALSNSPSVIKSIPEEDSDSSADAILAPQVHEPTLDVQSEVQADERFLVSLPDASQHTHGSMMPARKDILWINANIRWLLIVMYLCLMYWTDQRLILFNANVQQTTIPKLKLNDDELLAKLLHKLCVVRCFGLSINDIAYWYPSLPERFRMIACILRFNMYKMKSDVYVSFVCLMMAGVYEN